MLETLGIIAVLGGVVGLMIFGWLIAGFVLDRVWGKQTKGQKWSRK